MFTGLVYESARIVSSQARGLGKRIVIVVSNDEISSSQKEGASIALNGACMTSLDLPKKLSNQQLEFSFDVSPESLARTNLGQLTADNRVHVEYSLRVGQEMGGHMVSGHIDALGELESTGPMGDYWSMTVRLRGAAQQKIAPFLVEKGSIAVDGVSLTVNKVVDELSQGVASTVFEVLLVPHTLKVTFFKDLKPGSSVNLEADLMAKYAARLSSFSALSTKGL